MDKLQKSLFEFNNSLEKSYPIIPGEIGISLGGSRITEVPGRGQFVYVRLRSNQSEIIQVYNGKVFPGYGVPVLVQWNNNRYEIIGVDVQRYQQWLADNPIIAKHGVTHSMDKEGDKLGTDPVWVYPYQFMPSLVSPFPQSGILNAYINPLMVQYGGQWRYIGNTGTSNLTTYNPTSGSSIILVSLDASTGNPFLYATTGTYIPSSITGTNALLSYLPALDLGRYIPLSFVLLTSGTSGITWDNLFDVRQFFTPPPSGTVLFVQDEGIPRGLVSTLNFVGSNIDVTVSGTVGRVFTTGSSGGASLNFQDEGVPLGTPGTVNFVGANVDITISGTVARVFVTGSTGGGSSLPARYLYGLTLSNNVADATNDIDIAVGAAKDSTDTYDLTLASALTKRLDASWTVGTNQGGLDTGSIANTTYHVWLIKRSDTGVVDVLFSTSATAPTMPTNYDQKRRIGSIIRASAAILLFVQDGDKFSLTSPFSEINAGTSLGTAEVTQTLGGCPTGIRVEAFGAHAINAIQNTGARVIDLSIDDLDPQFARNETVFVASGGTANIGHAPWRALTNTSAQISYRLSVSNASTFFYLSTFGWIDRRGRD